MINLSNWLNGRGTFKDTVIGDVTLQIVSLSKGLIEELEALPTYASMVDFIANHGLSHERTRISDNENMRGDLPIIWALPEFMECKSQIVDAICKLSSVDEILAEKLELEELAAIEAEDAQNIIDGDNLIDTSVTLGQLNDDASVATDTNC